MQGEAGMGGSGVSRSHHQRIAKELGQLVAVEELSLSEQQRCIRSRILSRMGPGGLGKHSFIYSKIFIEDTLQVRHCAKSFCWLTMRQQRCLDLQQSEKKSCLTQVSNTLLQQPHCKIQASFFANVLIIVWIHLSNMSSLPYWFVGDNFVEGC